MNGWHCRSNRRMPALYCSVQLCLCIKKLVPTDGCEKLVVVAGAGDRADITAFPFDRFMRPAHPCFRKKSSNNCVHGCHAIQDRLARWHLTMTSRVQNNSVGDRDAESVHCLFMIQSKKRRDSQGNGEG